MADYDAYPAVLDDEEEDRKQPYPPVRSITPAEAPAIEHAPIANSVPAVAHSEPTLSGASMPQRPNWKDYEPAARHGWGKLGEIAASFNPVTNEEFNVKPHERAKNEYAAATKEYDDNFANQMKITEEQRMGDKEKSEAAYKEAQAKALEPTVMVKVPWQDEPIAMTQKGAEAYRTTQQKGVTSENVTGMKTASSEKIATGKEKSAEDIAKEKNASAERIARGHDLAHTESARIRAASANDPNKLTNTMKTMKQQAQATLPGIDRALDETEKIANLLGPIEGRWNDMMTGRYGGGDAAYKHYKDEIGMVSSAVTLAHARGRMSNELFEHFEKMFDAGKLSAENMIQALNVAHEWLSDYATMGDTPGAGAAPAAKQVRQQGNAAKPKTAEEYLKKFKK